MSHLGPYLFRRRFVDNIGSQFTDEDVRSKTKISNIKKEMETSAYFDPWRDGSPSTHSIQRIKKKVLVYHALSLEVF